MRGQYRDELRSYAEMLVRFRTVKGERQWERHIKCLCGRNRVYAIAGPMRIRDHLGTSDSYLSRILPHVSYMDWDV